MQGWTHEREGLVKEKMMAQDGKGDWGVQKVGKVVFRSRLASTCLLRRTNGSLIPKCMRHTALGSRNIVGGL